MKLVLVGPVTLSDMVGFQTLCGTNVSYQDNVLLQELCSKLEGQGCSAHIVNIMNTGLCHIHVRSLTAKLSYSDLYLIVP